jgi:hypothetical protein
VDSSKVTPGHWLAGIAGALLLLSMLVNWYEFKIEAFAGLSGSGNAFDSPGFLGGIADLIIIACAITAIGNLIVVASDSQVRLPMAGTALTALAGATATVLVFGRMIFQPGANQYISLKFGIYFAFLMAVLIAVGGYLGMQEEGATFDRAAGGPPA